MSESKLWKNINGALAARWDATRVDNKLDPGFPDVSYGIDGVNGFIELKCIQRWPKHSHTAIDFGASFKWQRRWISRRQEHGGLCFLLLWVVGPQPEWLLLDGDGVRKLPNKFMRTDLELLAGYHWHDWIHTEALVMVLSGKG